MPAGSIDFDTQTNRAFADLGALPAGQHWSSFDVPRREASQGMATILVTTIWNFHWSVEGSKRVPTRPAVSRDSSSGTLWYRMDRPGPGAQSTGRAHWNRIALARQFNTPIVGVLKDYSTSRCSLLDTFKVVETRDDLSGAAVWLQLQPARPYAEEVALIDIPGFRKASPDVIAIDSLIRPAASAAGQSRLTDVAKRRAIELYAMAKAIAHYEKNWPSVEDVSATESFDLRCRDRERELRVEVKGTSTGGGAILLTRNEVKHAANPANHVALFVVSSILVDAADTCSGGLVRVIEPWRFDPERLTAIAYEYSLESETQEDRSMRPHD